jgi:TM2 domain-containing membrane protein YozV
MEHIHCMKHLVSKMSSFVINSKSENTSKSYLLSFKRLKNKVCMHYLAQSIHGTLYILICWILVLRVIQLILQCTVLNELIN